MKTYYELEYPKVNKNFIKQLCEYMANRYIMGAILDVGCGEGYHVEAFRNLGLRVWGIDEPHDLENDGLPYKDGGFYSVFSKSFLEHIHKPMHLLKEIKRVLMPRGRVLFLVPVYTKFFWDDPTHVKPYTVRSLRETFEMAGFKVLECRLFYQFPFVWKFPFLVIIPKLIATFCPDSWQWRDKEERYQRFWVRHSKQPMILLWGEK